MNYTVYRILNKVNKKSYVGISSNFKRRKAQHLYKLRKGCHKNKHLQHSFNKYGESNFEFEVLFTTNTYEEMNEKEIYYINFFNSYWEGYNQTLGGEGSNGFKHSEETKKNFKLRPKVVFSAESRERLSKALKGKTRSKFVKRINHPDYSEWMGGEKHPVAKLKQIEVDIIRCRYLLGQTQASLSIEYEVTMTMINSIIRDKNWKDKGYMYIPKREFTTSPFYESVYNYIFAKIINHFKVE